MGLGMTAIGMRSMAQCHTIRTHAFEGVCGGHVSVMDCPGDSVIWDNGATGWEVDLDPGSYSYTVYQGGSVVYSGYTSVQTVGWSFAGSIHGTPWGGGGPGYDITGNAFVNYCGTQMYDHVCCVPSGADVYLLQDGMNFTGSPCLNCTNIWCVSTSFIFYEVPYGHQYVVCIDDPSCAGTCAMDEPVIVASCANLELVTSVLPSTPGGSTGVIELIEAIPDTTEPYPISSPVLGTITLFALPSNQQVGQGIYNTGGALWSDLDTGYYVISFQPDAGCQTAYDTLYVPAEMNTGSIGVAVAPALRIAPTVTDGMLLLSSSAGSAPVHVRIVDIRGRTVAMMVVPPGPLSVEGLAQGSYVLVATQGEMIFRNRFIKR